MVEINTYSTAANYWSPLGFDQREYEMLSTPNVTFLLDERDTLHSICFNVVVTAFRWINISLSLILTKMKCKCCTMEYYHRQPMLRMWALLSLYDKATFRRTSIHDASYQSPEIIVLKIL